MARSTKQKVIIAVVATLVLLAVIIITTVVILSRKARKGGDDGTHAITKNATELMRCQFPGGVDDMCWLKGANLVDQVLVVLGSKLEVLRFDLSDPNPTCTSTVLESSIILSQIACGQNNQVFGVKRVEAGVRIYNIYTGDYTDWHPAGVDVPTSIAASENLIAVGYGRRRANVYNYSPTREMLYTKSFAQDIKFMKLLGMSKEGSLIISADSRYGQFDTRFGERCMLYDVYDDTIIQVPLYGQLMDASVLPTPPSFPDYFLTKSMPHDVHPQRPKIIDLQGRFVSRLNWDVKVKSPDLKVSVQRHTALWRLMAIAIATPTYRKTIIISKVQGWP